MIKKILIIEDHAMSAKLMKDILASAGYNNVLYCENGLEGIKLACRHKPDLILCDIKLPDISGLEVIRALKSTFGTSDIPVVAVTACAYEKDKNAILATGCDAYISKPFYVLDFLRSIINILENNKIMGHQQPLEAPHLL